MRRLLSSLTLLLALLAGGRARAITPTEDALRRLIGNIDEQLDAWDVEGAKAELAKLEQAYDGDVEALPVLLMRGRVAFYSGDYAAAAKFYAQSGAENKEGSYRKLADDAQAETKDYLAVHSAHFDLYYPPGKDGVLAPYGLETLESAYTALSEDLHFTPAGKIRVEVLNDDEALSRLSTLTIEQIRTTGTIAICKFNRLMIISPKALLHGYDWRDTLNHELAHFFISMKSRNTVPIWLHEGLAKYEETRWRGEGGLAMTPASEALLGRAVKADKLITFEQMHPSMALLPSQEDAATAFAEVFHAIEFLKKKGGTALWNQIIENLKAGQSYQEAVTHAYKAPFTKFVGDWKGYLKTLKYPAELLSLEDEKVKFKDGKTTKKAKDRSTGAIEETELTDFADVADGEARKLAHLGGLLLERHKSKAAIEEFGKAYAKAGDKSVQLSNRYAEALFGEKRYPEAEQILKASLKVHPDYEVSRLHLGTALLAENKAAEARDHLLRGLDTDPFDPRLHQNLLIAFTQLNDKERAEQARAALKLLAPEHEEQPKASGEPTGSVLLASHPFASVSVDGKELGRTTPTELVLPVGKHHLKLFNAERGLSQELDVEVKPGQSEELRLELAESPGGDAAQPAPAQPAEQTPTR